MPKNICQIQAAVWRAMRLAGISLDTPGAIDIVRSITWVINQQPIILHRFPLSQNDTHTHEGFAVESYWPTKLTKFLHRAELLSLESPEGRQAIAELSATTIGLLASVWRLHGSPVEESQNFHEQKLLVIKYE
ncbi:hypothetical protein H0W80_01235 [Candidatus Saccharibacteria bacterium]|nr:hypothetical protein [Candidatus Saccharibacteria bacterium]